MVTGILVIALLDNRHSILCVRKMEHLSRSTYISVFWLESECCICPSTDKLHFVSHLYLCLWRKRNSAVSLPAHKEQLKIFMRSVRSRKTPVGSSNSIIELKERLVIITILAQLCLNLARVHARRTHLMKLNCHILPSWGGKKIQSLLALLAEINV